MCPQGFYRSIVFLPQKIPVQPQAWEKKQRPQEFSNYAFFHQKQVPQTWFTQNKIYGNSLKRGDHITWSLRKMKLLIVGDEKCGLLTSQVLLSPKRAGTLSVQTPGVLMPCVHSLTNQRPHTKLFKSRNECWRLKQAFRSLIFRKCRSHIAA